MGAVPVDPTTTDPRLRRYVNVVEEMSIASGVPVPRLFVLEQEDGINAFAAGYAPADAAITVTRGALARLNRDELQGVIGHEFSHVLNGDMRLNVRLIGLLNGILLLGLVGLRFLQFGGGRGGKKGNPLLVIAIALLVLGFVGQFFAGLIQAAVSRQREWLADASAVQFTRQPSGLVGALKKIAGLPQGSALHDTRVGKQLSHMLFGDGTKGISRLYATHPPLLERIRALEPDFDASRLGADGRGGDPDTDADEAGSRVRAARAGRPVRRRSRRRDVSARVATFSPADLERGRDILAQLPPRTRQLALQPSTAAPLVLALLLDDRADVRDRQLALVAQHLGAGVAAATAEYAPSTTGVPALLRLPLVSLAAPALVERAAAAARCSRSPHCTTLAAADGAITLFEYCLTRLVAAQLDGCRRPAAPVAGRADAARVGAYGRGHAARRRRGGGQHRRGCRRARLSRGGRTPAAGGARCPSPSRPTAPRRSTRAGTPRLARADDEATAGRGDRGGRARRRARPRRRGGTVADGLRAAALPAARRAVVWGCVDRLRDRSAREDLAAPPPPSGSRDATRRRGSPRRPARSEAEPGARPTRRVEARTGVRDRRAAHRPVTSAASVIAPPRGVWRNALSSRLASTCRSRTGSTLDGHVRCGRRRA